MRTAVLSLSCVLAATSLFAQQAAPSPSPAKPVTPPPAVAAPQQPGDKLPEHPLTDEQAAKLLVIFGADKAKNEVKEGMLQLVRTRMPFAPQDVSDDFTRSLDKMDTSAAVIAVYKRHISTEDADAIIAFYKTPTGKEVIDAMPLVLQQSEQAAVALGRKTAQEVVERHRTEIQDAAKQYQQDHAPKPAPSLNTPPAAPAAKPGSATPQPQ